MYFAEDESECYITVFRLIICKDHTADFHHHSSQ